MPATTDADWQDLLVMAGMVAMQQQLNELIKVHEHHVDEDPPASGFEISMSTAAGQHHHTPADQHHYDSADQHHHDPAGDDAADDNAAADDD